MAQGQWVNIPGKGKRWQQPSGELMMQKPGLGFVQAQLAPFANFLGNMFQAPGALNLGTLQARPPMPGLPADYKQTELAAGAAAERFRPGAGFPGQQAAAERAYEQEKTRVAQLTAQDPEIQRYEKARAAAKTQEEMNAARDIGMQIWAQRNPELAANVKPGQSGYDVIQGTLAGQAAAQGYGYQMPQQMIMTPPPGPNVPQGLPAVESIGAAETYGDKGLVVDPEMAKKFQALLNQSKG